MPKNHKCVCQVCGDLHEIRAEFLHCNRSAVIGGEERLVLSCGQHPAEELKQLWHSTGERCPGVKLAQRRAEWEAEQEAREKSMRDAALSSLLPEPEDRRYER